MKKLGIVIAVIIVLGLAALVPLRGVLAQTPLGPHVDAIASKVECTFENVTNSQKQTTTQANAQCNDETNEQPEPGETPDAAPAQ